MLIWYAYVFPLKTHLLRFSYNFFLGQPPRPSPRLSGYSPNYPTTLPGAWAGRRAIRSQELPFIPAAGRRLR